MVAVPILQYGMYSGTHYMADTLTVYSTKINGKQLDPTLLTSGEYDNIQSYLDGYENYKTHNAIAYQTMGKYINRAGLGSYFNHYKYNVVVADSVHYNWLKNKLQSAVGEPLHSLSAVKQQFTWSGTSLQPADSVAKILFGANR